MPFQDLLNANSDYLTAHSGLDSGVARKGLAILTCIDSRIDPLTAFGLQPGDAKMIRNAGARVTDDALRSLAVSCHLLGAVRVALVAHTDCGMVKADQETIVNAIEEAGADSCGMDFLTVDDQIATLKEDLQKIRDSKLLPPDLEVGGFIYNVATGELQQVV